MADVIELLVKLSTGFENYVDRWSMVQFDPAPDQIAVVRRSHDELISISAEQLRRARSEGGERNCVLHWKFVTDKYVIIRAHLSRTVPHRRDA